MGCTFSSNNDDQQLLTMKNDNLQSKDTKKGTATTLNIETNPEIMSETQPIELPPKEKSWIGPEADKGISVEEQLKNHVNQLFDAFDQDHNGLLSLSEFQKLIQVNNSEFSEKDARLLLGIIDEDKSKTVDRE